MDFLKIFNWKTTFHCDFYCKKQDSVRSVYGTPVSVPLKNGRTGIPLRYKKRANADAGTSRLAFDYAVAVVQSVTKF